jgi:hypothetical protein
MDHRVLEGNLQLLLLELDQSIAVLQQTNGKLDANNLALKEELAIMDQTVKHLRQENRRIGWQQGRNRVLTFLVALGLGVWVGSTLSG